MQFDPLGCVGSRCSTNGGGASLNLVLSLAEGPFSKFEGLSKHLSFLMCIRGSQFRKDPFNIAEEVNDISNSLGSCSENHALFRVNGPAVLRH